MARPSASPARRINSASEIPAAIACLSIRLISATLTAPMGDLYHHPPPGGSRQVDDSGG
jgi:hypothetical protein